jgi:hypothetical protein
VGVGYERFPFSTFISGLATAAINSVAAPLRALSVGPEAHCPLVRRSFGVEQLKEKPRSRAFPLRRASIHPALDWLQGLWSAKLNDSQAKIIGVT